MDPNNAWDSLSHFSELPTELQTLVTGHAHDRLQLIARHILDRTYTDHLLVLCEDLIPDSCTRFSSFGTSLQVLGAYGRILQFLPFLAETAYDHLTSDKCLSELQSELHGNEFEYLLSTLRLLHFDHDHFSNLVNIDTLVKLSQHTNGGVRVLAARVLSLYLCAAEKSSRQITERWQGGEDDLGWWEGKEIHYAFLPLWEEQRERKLRHALDNRRKALELHQTTIITPSADNSAVASLAGVLLPLSHTHSPDDTPSTRSTPLAFVHTPTADINLRSLALALKSTSPLLITGRAGSGKTTTVRFSAQCLQKLDTMITLHINEQSDAKTLIGIYTTGSTPGSFSWQPGVLTKAVTEGRWVLIEDLERAPSEVMSVLLPLIERRELNIPGRNQVIRAAFGFRLLATTRTIQDHKGQEHDISSRILGIRQWQKVAFANPPIEELPSMISGSFSGIDAHIPLLVNVFSQLQELQRDAKRSTRSGTSSLRPLSQRELLTWASRVSGLVGHQASITREQEDQIFLSAVDSFAGFLPDGAVRDDYAAAIARDCGIDPQRRDHLLTDRTIPHRVEPGHVTIGLYTLPCHSSGGGSTRNNSRFSVNRHTSRQLERIASAVSQAEPLLLVGETGTGKTTSIQYLADMLGKRLVPFNLSQQSESGDMLGGFKPVSTRTIIVPLQDEFDYLFKASFSARVLAKNQDFLDKLNNCLSRQQWRKVCKCWHTALAMIDNLQKSSGTTNWVERLHKKRKQEYVQYLPRWERFREQVTAIEARLQSGGDSAVAFSFVEGNIVRAAREGDWVLLDEINLASPDTLEALADLFDKSPSIILSEAGSTTAIKAHPDFRIFAAMNPATDVGKKDLPSGIRSRFTELYVESPDRDLQSLQHIVQTYISEPVLSEIASRLHQKVQELANDGKLVDGAGHRPHFSLRTLTRVLLFARDISSQCSLRRALHEGFCMSYLTLLDLESEQKVLSLIDKHFYEMQSKQQGELNQVMKQPSNDQGQKYAQEGRYWMKVGKQPLQDQPHYIITDFVRRNLDKLIRAAMTRRFPILLQGPTSSGKTSMVEYLAKKTGHKFVRINNHEHTDLQEYLGTYVSGREGKLQFQEGLLVQALREGHWIVLDELNLAPTDVLEALNRLLDDNRELLIPETQEIVRPHPDFMLFATQNPAGIYGGRKVLSRAFRNRFLELHFDDIPVSELHIILERRAQIPPKWSQLIVRVYEELSMLRQEGKVFEQKGFATLRDLFRWALRPVDTKQQLAEQGFMLLGERCRRPEERQEVKEVIQKVMSSPGPRVSIDETALYAQMSASLPSGDIVWTKAMRRLYGLTVSAINNNEPVLLVGETGCGKTTVCQVIAQLRNQALNIVNAHQNTETGDLIGAQRPARNRSAVEKKLIDLVANFPNAGVQEALNTTGLSTALSVIDSLDRQDEAIASRYNLVQEARGQLNVLFEWKDGSLVEAMKKGSLFLLDEISLADDSVLERLNSVLEPHRSMLLAEKGSLDSFVIAAESFQFFATMNPGGDYGKKELSPALRNRFTEIWVPALSDEEDILSVITAKLDDGSYAKPMLEFAVWFQARYNTSASSAVHIRDLLAWAEFMNMTPDHLSSSLWFLNGAGMVFIDRLGAEPAGMIAINPKAIPQELEACTAYLAPIVEKAKAELLSSQGWTIEGLSAPFVVVGDDQRFPELLFTRAMHVPSENPISIWEHFGAATMKHNAARVARAMILHKPVLLEGPPGVGKTTLVMNLATIADVPLTRINLSEQTDLMDLFGSDVPTEGAGLANFAWRDAPFLRAMQKGEWVLLDEMNLASQSVLEGLNACLDHRGEVFIPELNQTFKKHDNFRLFAAQNPHHQGGGRKGLPASFVNRFTVVYASSLLESDLLALFKNDPTDRFPRAETAVQLIGDFNGALDQRSFGMTGAPWELNLRDIKRWFELADDQHGLLVGPNFLSFLDMIITQRFRTRKDRNIVRQIFELKCTYLRERYRYDPDIESGTTLSISESYLQIGFGLLNRNELTSSRLKRLYESYDIRPHLHIMESIILCIHRNWPVLLVGPSGAGKTTMIERLAEMSGANVFTFALNAEIDSMDLVGGYEQHDVMRNVHDVALKLQEFTRRLLIRGFVNGNVHEIALQIWQEASQMLSASNTPGSAKLQSIRQAIRNLDLQANPAEEAIVFELLNEIDMILAEQDSADRGRFEWINGNLVQAMTRGDWLVLDNANLCSPAALDRLNSLLEPNGELLINEHTDKDGEAQRVKPHPNFRVILTMDPKHGELSRALRNRCVELFLLPEDDSETGVAAYDTDATYHHDSRMSRFAHVKHLEQLPAISPSFLDVALTSERLAPADLAVRDAFIHELNSGLFNVPAEELAGYLSLLNNHLGHAIMGAESKLLTLDSQDLAALQVLHPNHNPWLANALARHQLNQPWKFSRQLRGADLLRHIAPMKYALASIRADYRPGTAMSRLVESSSPDSLSAPFKILTTALRTMEDTFKNASQWVLAKSLDREVSKPNVVSETLRLVESLDEIRFYWWDIYDYARNKDTTDTILQILYWRSARQITRALDRAQLYGINTILRPLFNDMLIVWQQSAGQAVEPTNLLCIDILWTALRPNAIRDEAAYLRRCALERLVDEFDSRFWHIPLPLEQLISFRSSIVDVLTMPSADAAAGDEAYHLIKHAMTDIQTDNLPELAAEKLLRSEFAHLVQLMDLCKSSNVTLDGSEIDRTIPTAYTLAGRSSKSVARTSFRLHLGGSSPRTRLALKLLSSFHATNAVFDAKFPDRALHGFQNLASTPIHLTDLLSTKLGVMGRLVATNANSFDTDLFAHLHDTLSTLAPEIWEVLKAESRRLYENDFRLRPYTDIWLLDVDGSEFASEQACAVTPEPDRYIKYCMKPTIQYLNNQSTETIAGFNRKTFTLTWLSFFVGCVRLYTPPISYDPAMNAKLVYDLHLRHMDTLEREVDAMKRLEQAITGENVSSRILQAESRFMQYHAASPEQPKVWRSPDWDAEPLQLLLRTLSQTMRVFDSKCLVDPDAMLKAARDSQTRRSLETIHGRLKDSFPEFRDFTEPLYDFLTALRIGFAMIDQLDVQESEKETPHSVVVIPMAGEKPDSNAGNSLSLLSGPRALKHLGLSRRLKPSKLSELDAAMFDSLQRSHASWKKRLEAEQDKTAAQSSLYRFRGDAELETEVDETEFLQLFPGSDEVNQPQRDQAAAVLDVQRFASDIAVTIEAYFDQDRPGREIILDLLDDVACDRKTVPQHRRTQIGLELTPALIRQLDKRLTALTDVSSQKSASYNIYTDPNLEQIQKLTSVVVAVRSRFRTIQKTWPEHATLEDVLKTCVELTDFPHSEPLIKILAKLEKLHGEIHEWQTVASKEFSAVQCYDAVTDLIVSWRQLELSTWSRMLDQEAAKCKYDAKSWFFLAYESISAVSDYDGGFDDNSRRYIIELVKTLESFIKSTGLGQFEARLQMLSDLRKVVLQRQRGETRLAAAVSDALANFVSFMEPFKAPVREAIAKGRAALDKDMKNVIQLASWKDRNIMTLRQSARTSHRKLFKVIRKFRALLGQPVESIIAGGSKSLDTSAGTLTLSVKHTYRYDADLATALPAQREYCEVNLPTWHDVHARFRNTASTVNMINKLSECPDSAISGAVEVSVWVSDVLNEAEMLRKATPMNLTVENKATAQHLKSRKRALFADVLKHLRLMGYKSNLGTDLLERQSSLAMVLATSASATEVSALTRAEVHLHDLLHHMPMARNALREHSDNLTGAEVGRSVALLESMLHDLLAQRHQAVSHANKSSVFNEQLLLLRNLAIAQDPSPVSDVEVQNLKNERDAVIATAAMLEASTDIMRAQFRIAKEDGNEQIDAVVQLSSRLNDLAQEWKILPRLADNVVDSRLRSCGASSLSALAEVHRDLETMIEDSPAVEPILRQVQYWCQPQLNGPAPPHASVDWQEAQKAILSLVDHMLGAIQSLPDTLKALPSNAEDALWLSKEISTMESALDRFALGPVTARLVHVLSLLSATEASSTQLMVSLLATVFPIIAQYQNAHDELLDRYVGLHTSVASMSAKLSKIFTNLSRDGFCAPREKESESSNNDSKLEAGTGLGDGEGAEDISKAIGDDEDLTELAQEKNEKDTGEDVEDEKDAVDMADADLEGEMGEGESKEEDEEGNEEDQDNEDIEEEAGSVDDLGENTVDEKMWDEGGEMDADKDQTAEEAEGTKDEDELAAGGEEKKKEKQEAKKDEGEEGGDEEVQEDLEGAEEDENAPPQEAERADPTMPEEENLDLPDDIDMDGQEKDEDIDDDLDMMDDDKEDEAPIPDGEATAEDEEPTDDIGEPEQEPEQMDREMSEDPLDESGEETKEVGEDANEEQAPEDPEDVLQDNRPDDSAAADDIVPSDARGTGLDQEQEQQDEMDTDAQTGAAERPQGSEGETKDMQQASGNQGERGDTDDTAPDAAQDIPDEAEQAREKFKKLGDALEKWYKNQRDIQDSRQRDEQKKADQEEAETRDVEFEHLDEEEADGDAQALGAAREEEATAIDDAGTGVNEEERRDQFVDDEQPNANDQDVDMADTDAQKPVEQEEDRDPTEAKAFVGEQAKQQPEENVSRPASPMSVDMDDEEEDAAISALDNRLQATDLGLATSLTQSQAQGIWAKHESSTRLLSLQLQEQLRLILSPTQTSKLRGDFRTGKRLNIKRIIPYIASGYKRDKIWLRRSVPSKRQYQILLALDDSRSMAEAGVADMAFDTLALVSKALSMLEAGELAVLGFGAAIRCPVGFGDAWGLDAGANVVRELRFDQAGTDVKGLLHRAKNMFEDAAARRSGPTDGAVWQLMVIVGDGVFEDAEGVRVAERALREMRVMVVFVVVDQVGSGKKQSIADLQVATFSKAEDGSTALVTKRYLETFPFRYYLIVRDVVELPGVLASALRQWFAEVAESG